MKKIQKFILCVYCIAPALCFGQVTNIVIGASANNEDGDPPRTAYTKINGLFGGNVFRVDSQLGNDATAAPSLHISNAVYLASVAYTNTGIPQLVSVNPGFYTENNLLRVGVNLYFSPGAKVFWTPPSTNNPGDYWGIFDDRTCGPTTNVIAGYGDFYFQGYTNILVASTQTVGTNHFGTIVTTNAATKLTVNCNSVQHSSWVESSGTLHTAVYNQNGELNLNCISIYDPFALTPLLFTNIGVPHTKTIQSYSGGVAWSLGVTRVTCLTNQTSGDLAYGLWGVGLTTNDVSDFYYYGYQCNGKIYGDFDSTNARTWITLNNLEIGTNHAASSTGGQAVGLFGSGKYYLNFMKVQNSTSIQPAATLDSSVGPLGTSNLLVWVDANKVTTSNIWFNCTVGTWHVRVDQLEDLSGGSATNTLNPQYGETLDDAHGHTLTYTNLLVPGLLVLRTNSFNLGDLNTNAFGLWNSNGNGGTNNFFLSVNSNNVLKNYHLLFQP